MISQNKVKNNAFRITWAIFTKDLLESLKNKNTLTILITALLMMLVYRGLPLLEADREPPVVVVYQESPSSLVDNLENSQALDVFVFNTRQEMTNRVIDEEVPALGLVIPEGYMPGSDTASGDVLEAYIMKWVSPAQSKKLLAAVEAELAKVADVPVSLDVNMLNVGSESTGLGIQASMAILFLILMVGMLLVTHLILEEKLNRTMDMLMVSPASVTQLVTGKALTGLFYCLLGGGTALIVNYRLVVHWWLVILGIIVGSIFTVSVGLWLGGRVENRGQMSIWAWVLVIPLFFPVFLVLERNLVPDVVYRVSRLVPTAAVFQVIKNGFAGTFPIGEQFLWLGYVLFCSLVVYGLVAWRIRKQDRGNESALENWFNRMGVRDSQNMPGNEIVEQSAESESNEALSKFTSHLVDGGTSTTSYSPVISSKWRRIWTVARKDIGEIVKNKLAISIIVGALFLVVPSVTLPKLFQMKSGQGIVMVDEGNSEILKQISSLQGIRIIPVDTRNDMESILLGSSTAIAGIIIPADFDQQVEMGGRITLQGYAPHWANMTKVENVTRILSESLNQSSKASIQVNFTGNSLYPEAGVEGNILISSLQMIFVIFTLGTALIPLLIVEEKESHTLDALLVSPASFVQVIAGKALAGMVYCLLAAAVVVPLFGYMVLHWEFLLLGVLCCAVFAVSYGLLVGTLSNNPATTGIWGGLGLLGLFGLTALGFYTQPDWSPLVKFILDWQPGSAMVKLFNQALLNSVSYGLLAAEVLVILLASGSILLLSGWLAKRYTR